MDEWLRIGEVASRTGLSQRTLRHYDTLGLLVPSGRSLGDYRLYSPEDLVRLLAIQHLKSLGLSLQEVGSALDDPGFDASALLREHIAAVEARITAEKELLGRLRRLTTVADAGWEEVVEAIALSERLRHPEAGVRFRAALGSHTSASVDDLAEALRREDEPEVREAVTWALTQHGPGTADRLSSVLARGDARARHALAHVLGKLRDPSAVPVLGRLLADADERVAAKAAFGLGQIGGVEAVDALVGALGEGRSLVRDEVAASLARTPEAVEPLIREARSASPDTRALAAETLGLLGAPAAAGTLAELLSDPDPDVRFAALLALGQIGGDDAARAVEGEIDSPDERARLLARRLVSDRQAEAATGSRASRKRRAT